MIVSAKDRNFLQTAGNFVPTEGTKFDGYLYKVVSAASSSYCRELCEAAKAAVMLLSCRGIMHAELATDYFDLRSADAQRKPNSKLARLLPLVVW